MLAYGGFALQAYEGVTVIAAIALVSMVAIVALGIGRASRGKLTKDGLEIETDRDSVE